MRVSVILFSVFYYVILNDAHCILLYCSVCASHSIDTGKAYIYLCPIVFCCVVLRCTSINANINMNVDIRIQFILISLHLRLLKSQVG